MLPLKGSITPFLKNPNTTTARTTRPVHTEFAGNIYVRDLFQQHKVSAARGLESSGAGGEQEASLQAVTDVLTFGAVPSAGVTIIGVRYLVAATIVFGVPTCRRSYNTALVQYKKQHKNHS